MAASYCILLLNSSSLKDLILSLLTILVYGSSSSLDEIIFTSQGPTTSYVQASNSSFLLHSCTTFFLLSYVQGLLHFLFHNRWHIKTLCHLALPMSQVLLHSSYPSTEGSITIMAFNFMLASDFFTMAP